MDPCPSCDSEFPDFDGIECKCGYRESVPASIRAMLRMERKELAKLRGKTVSLAHLDSRMDKVEIVCTDGTTIRITSGLTNIGNTRINITAGRQRRPRP